ncbi:MAG: hypothetical protein JWO37_1489 [Acidimicrobiales bacterium]|jgi:hypothetical protein|nr:hypothetical protein [Acidimicrobiales bacterium]
MRIFRAMPVLLVAAWLVPAGMPASPDHLPPLSAPNTDGWRGRVGNLESGPFSGATAVVACASLPSSTGVPLRVPARLPRADLRPFCFLETTTRVPIDRSQGGWGYGVLYVPRLQSPFTADLETILDSGGLLLEYLPGRPGVPERNAPHAIDGGVLRLDVHGVPAGMQRLSPRRVWMWWDEPIAGTAWQLVTLSGSSNPDALYAAARSMSGGVP